MVDALGSSFLGRLVKPDFYRGVRHVLVNVTHPAFHLLDFGLNALQLVGKSDKIGRFGRFS